MRKQSEMQALAILRSLAEKHPEVPDYQHNLGNIHVNLGLLYRAAGRTEEAKAAFEDALRILKILAKKHPELPGCQAALFGTFYNLAGCNAQSLAENNGHRHGRRSIRGLFEGFGGNGLRMPQKAL